ncbi:carbohydrate-binding module family 18 protein, partial [Cucurbitaria berberidis CBS 394.84]
MLSGSTTTHCGTGCQQAYGTCGSSTPSKPVSTNARCGSKYGGQTCQGSVFGNCCSQFDFCGSTKDYCSASICQKDYGSCTG